MEACSRRLLSLCAALAIVVISVALAPAASLGSFPGGNGVIAYAGPDARDEYRGIWAVDPENGYQLRLTSGEDTWPSFSPSGNMLAFQRRSHGTDTIYIAHADGSNPQPLAEGSEPAFSPDGQEVVFVRPGGLYVTALTPGSHATQITDYPGDSLPNWGLTGSIAFDRVVHQGGRIVGSEIDTLTLPGLEVHQIIVYYASVLPLSTEWSPDGMTLSVALCTKDKRSIVQGSPLLVVRPGCAPRILGPEGRGVAEAGRGALAGSRFDSCPPAALPEISWQPLVAGTMRIPTVKCKGKRQRPPLGKLLGHAHGRFTTHGGYGGTLCVPGKHGRGKICRTIESPVRG
jgi:hypothetical protein